MRASEKAERDAIERDPVRERDDLAGALEPLMASIDFYMGPNARTAVGQDSVRSYRRLQLALRRARGKSCPECNDSGRSRIYGGSYPCSLRGEPNHQVELPADVIAFMVERRDRDRAEDAAPRSEDDGRGYRLGPPAFEAELAIMEGESRG